MSVEAQPAIALDKIGCMGFVFKALKYVCDAPRTWQLEPPHLPQLETRN
jgi:hypothetical protein